MKKVYKINIDCANCARKLEQSLHKIKVVSNPNVNFMLQKVTLEVDENNEAALRDICITCKKFDRSFGKG